MTAQRRQPESDVDIVAGARVAVVVAALQPRRHPMEPITPRQEARSMPRVPVDALPPAEHRVPPAGAHPRRNLVLGLAGLGLLTLLLVALVARNRDRHELRDTTVVGGEVTAPRSP
jgi:hypothetical protein